MCINRFKILSLGISVSQNNCSLIVALFLLLFCFYQCKVQSISEITAGEKMEIKVTSTAFEERGMIPKKYTCDGIDASPPLAWTSVPEGTRSLALICYDADVPYRTWIHWIIFNIPADVKGLSEKIPSQKRLPNGARQGRNDFSEIGYGGPCPPGSTHRYYFKLYALDQEINLESGATRGQLLKAMEGHILAKGELMGKYKGQ